jgi:hypothetical protein
VQPPVCEDGVNIVKRKKRQVVELTDRDAAYDVLEKEETIKVTFQFFSYLCTKLNPVLYTWFRDSSFTCDGSLTIQVFPLLLNTGTPDI